MSNFVSLEDAAKKLGVSTDELVEMRSRGEIFGYRDGGSWKFKPQEIERVASEMMGDALDEDPAGSSILMADEKDDDEGSTSSGIKSDDSGKSNSDVSLVAEPGTDSDVRLVASSDPSDSGTSGANSKDSGQPPSQSTDDDLQLIADDDDDDELASESEDGGDLMPTASDSSAKGESDESSDVELSSEDLQLTTSDDSSDVTGGSNVSLDSDKDLVKGDSDKSSSVDVSSGSDLELADDADLVLGGGSDVALGSDSGINLMSPSDSGISLEDEPLDLAASGISGLDLAEGSDVESPSSGGSAVDFQQDEDFQLSPSGELDADDDSGSQVIELEDSSEFGDEAVALPEEAGGFDDFADVDDGAGFEGDDAFGEPAPAGAAVATSPEVPYRLIEVLGLLVILLIMSLSGILVTDIVRNMWAWSGEANSLTSGFTEAVVSIFPN